VCLARARATWRGHAEKAQTLKGLIGTA
jgi:hypothetical protein